LRMVDALQFTEKHGEVCPANWSQGAKSMKPTQEGLEEFFT
ncbi:MAG: peroxiredoxin, partial [Nitrospina sp.]|nr:peroxiredoxin [Nitrospina sp.]